MPVVHTDACRMDFQLLCDVYKALYRDPFLESKGRNGSHRPSSMLDFILLHRHKSQSWGIYRQCIPRTVCLGMSSLPRKYFTTTKQRRISVDATLGLCIDIDTTLFEMCMSAGLLFGDVNFKRLLFDAK